MPQKSWLKRASNPPANPVPEWAAALAENEATIVAELDGAQGGAVDVGGYFHPDAQRAIEAMRPSATLNEALAEIA